MNTQHDAKEAMGDGGLLDRKGGEGEETEILQIRI